MNKKETLENAHPKIIQNIFQAKTCSRVVLACLIALTTCNSPLALFVARWYGSEVATNNKSNNFDVNIFSRRRPLMSFTLQVKRYSCLNMHIDAYSSFRTNVRCPPIITFVLESPHGGAPVRHLEQPQQQNISSLHFF